LVSCFKMCLNYRMGKNRRTLKKSLTAKKRQNGGVAPVNYTIPPNQRQPTEAIMERATTAGGKRTHRKRTRKNKTIRRYKKQMKGGNGLIKNEEELKKSWDNKLISSWEADDGMGTRERLFREGYTYDELKKRLNYFFKKMKEHADKKGYIKEIYN